MAEQSPSNDDYRLEDLALAVGWHLVQGIQLSGMYARHADKADGPEWAEFFRRLETAYGSVLDDASSWLPMDRTMAWGRPPYR